MKILIWNVDYWRNYSKDGWIEKCLNELNKIINENNIEIILLQEINPFKLFSLDYEIVEPYRYERIISKNRLLLYHELFFEIPEKYRSNLWGNVIIVNRTYNKFKNILEYNNEVNYYGRNGLMCYSFVFDDIGEISFINFYNKSNNGTYTMLSESCFEIKNDINDIIKYNHGLVVFAGDFNTGSNNDDFEHNNRYKKLCEKLLNFTDISNGDPKFNQNTTYWYDAKNSKGLFLRNDFCFVNNLKCIEKVNLKISKEIEWEGDENNKRWKGISDHCPIIIDIIPNIHELSIDYKITKEDEMKGDKLVKWALSDDYC